jgi:hypothetical protein
LGIEGDINVIKAFLSRPLWVKSHVENHLAKLNEKLKEMDFEIRTIGVNSTSFASPFNEIVEVLKTCHCAIILGFPLMYVREGTLKGEEIKKGFSLPSEWNQIEAAVSLMLGKPTLMMLHNGVASRGLFDRGAANVFIHVFNSLGPKWVDDTVPKLKDLKEKVLAQQRH